MKKGAKVDVENWNGKTPPRSDAMYGRTAVRLTRVGGEQNVLGFDEGGDAIAPLTFDISMRVAIAFPAKPRSRI